MAVKSPKAKAWLVEAVLKTDSLIYTEPVHISDDMEEAVGWMKTADEFQNVFIVQALNRNVSRYEATIHEGAQLFRRDPDKNEVSSMGLCLVGQRAQWLLHLFTNDGLQT